MKNLNKLDPEVLKKLLVLLKNMTFKDTFKPKESTRFERIVDFIMYGGLIVTAVLIISVLIAGTVIKLSSPEDENWGREVIAFLLLLANVPAIVMAVSLLALIVSSFYKNRRRVLEDAFEIYAQAACDGIQDFNELMMYPRIYLQYALNWYEGTYYNSRERAHLFGGEIKKIGFFPAIAAVVFSSKLLVENTSNIASYVLLFLAGGFMIMSFLMSFAYEKPNQVVQLLRLAIDSAE